MASDPRSALGAVRFEITGVQETLGLFNLFGKKIAKRVMRKAVRAGGNVVLKSVRAAAPVKNGQFKRSLILKEKQYQATSFAVIGQTRLRGDKETARKAKALSKRKHSGGISGRGDVVPTHFVENDVAPHDIDATKGGPAVILNYNANGTPVFAKVVRHRGTRGTQFMRRAGQQSTGAAIDVFTGKFRDETFKEAQNLLAGYFLLTNGA